MIDSIELASMHKEYLRNYWVRKILQVKRKANQTKYGYYTVSLISAIGGTIITFLAAQKFTGNISDFIHWLVISFGLIVAISGTIATLFGFGKYMQDYHMIYQDLEKEWWNFFLLEGFYAEYQTHIIAFSTFKERMENIRSRIDAIETQRARDEIPRIDRANIDRNNVN
jgi:hypothetical protein